MQGSLGKRSVATQGWGEGLIQAGYCPLYCYFVSSLLGWKMILRRLSLLAVFAWAQEEAAETRGLRTCREVCLRTCPRGQGEPEGQRGCHLQPVTAFAPVRQAVRQSWAHVECPPTLLSISRWHLRGS